MLSRSSPHYCYIVLYLGDGDAVAGGEAAGEAAALASSSP